MVQLSKRENDVLGLLCEGLRNKEIASTLEVGEETVKSHLTSIYRKMEVGSRSEAIVSGLRTRYGITD